MGKGAWCVLRKFPNDSQIHGPPLHIQSLLLPYTHILGLARSSFPKETKVKKTIQPLPKSGG